MHVSNLFDRISSLQFKYPNIDRIRRLHAPLLLMHGDVDNKIHMSHSLRLFDKATDMESVTATPAPSNQTSTHVQYKYKGVIAHNYCKYPVEWHAIPQAGHKEVYASRIWLTLIPSFVNTSEAVSLVHSDTNC